jgi:hypothetical protein
MPTTSLGLARKDRVRLMAGVDKAELCILSNLDDIVKSVTQHNARLRAVSRGLLCSLLYGTTGAGIRPTGVPSPTGFQVCVPGFGEGHDSLPRPRPSSSPGQQRTGSGAIHDLAYVPYDNPRWGATEFPSGLEPVEELAEDRVLDRSVRRHAMGVVGSFSLADVVEGNHEPSAAVGGRRAHVCLEDRQFNRV